MPTDVLVIFLFQVTNNTVANLLTYRDGLDQFISHEQPSNGNVFLLVIQKGFSLVTWWKDILYSITSPVNHSIA